MLFSFQTPVTNSMPVSPSLTAPPCNESEVHCVFFWSQVCTGCNYLLLLFVIRLVMLYGTWSGALSLIWKCKLVTRAIAQVLRAVPRHEHIWPVLHRPCWSLVRFQTELMELVMIYKSHKYSETCYLRKIIFPSEL